MNLIENFIKVNISKLFADGNITKTYQEMYLLAEKIAHQELKIEWARLEGSLRPKVDFDKILKIQKDMAEFKQKRIQHHINEMKDLLILREDLKKNEKNNNRGRR